MGFFLRHPVCRKQDSHREEFKRMDNIYNPVRHVFNTAPEPVFVSKQDPLDLFRHVLVSR